MKDYSHKGGLFLDTGKFNSAIRRLNLAQNHQVHATIQGWNIGSGGTSRGAEDCYIYIPFDQQTGYTLSFLVVYEQMNYPPTYTLNHRVHISEVLDSAGVSVSHTQILNSSQTTSVGFNKSDGSGEWSKTYVFVETKVTFSGLVTGVNPLRVKFHPYWNVSTSTNEDVYDFTLASIVHDYRFCSMVIATNFNASVGTIANVDDSIPATTYNALLSDLRNKPPKLLLSAGLFDLSLEQLGNIRVFDRKGLTSQDSGDKTAWVGYKDKTGHYGVFLTYTAVVTGGGYERKGYRIPYNAKQGSTVTYIDNVELPAFTSGGYSEWAIKDPYDTIGSGYMGGFAKDLTFDQITFFATEYQYYIESQLAYDGLRAKVANDPLNPAQLKLIFDVFVDSMYGFAPSGLIVAGVQYNDTSMIPESDLTQTGGSSFPIHFNQGGLVIAFRPGDFLLS